MAKAVLSHAFLVGYLNAKLSSDKLDRNIWTPETLSLGDYQTRCAQYYKSHVDAMVEADGQGNRPDFLKNVCHFKHTYKKQNGDNDYTKGIRTHLNVKKRNGMEIAFEFTLCAIHLYFFPLGFVLVSIEIDDSDTELNTITDLHYSLLNWDVSLNSANNQELRNIMEPLAKLLANGDLSNLIVGSSKMKMMQIIQTNGIRPDDTLLYELATFCPVGVVKGNSNMTPSNKYYEEIMDKNSISAYNNWKALALNDSFTVLSVTGSSEDSLIVSNSIDNNWIWPWYNLYYPLIYIRCVFEKTYCQSRNTAYRLNDINNELVEKLVEEITDMEKYYFYDDISYNFLPSMLYKKIALGMGIIQERDAISNQIRTRLREKQERRNNIILAGVSIFAVFSVIWDLCSLLKDAFFCGYTDKTLAIILFTASILIIIILLNFILGWDAIWNYLKSKIGNVTPKKDVSKVVIDNTTRMHVIENHFSEKAVGSKFEKTYTLDSFLKMAQVMFPATFKYAKPDDTDNKIKISLKFPYNIGYCNVVAKNELNEKEIKNIKIIERGTKKANAVSSNRSFPTKECQIILTKDWHLITMFPGEMAPPLPDSPDSHDEYWDNHVFIEPINQ